MRAKIYIRYKDGILDPQGTTVCHALNSMGFDAINDAQLPGYIIEINDQKWSKIDEWPPEKC